MSDAKQEQIDWQHYIDMAIQPFEYIHGNKWGFIEGCVVKYDGVEDLRKARHFIDLLIQMEEGR